MSASQPSARDARFVGTIPELYDRYLGPMLFEQYAADLAARLQLPARDQRAVLEVAAGTGILTMYLRMITMRRHTALTVTDLNGPMLAVAEQKLRRFDAATSEHSDGAGITWRTADATELPFADESFDAVVCQFGIMFFPDKPRAARESFRVLRPGGQWLFNVWGSWEENRFARVVHETITSFFPVDPPAFYRVPFSFHDPDAMRTLVVDAGFAEPEIITLDRVAESPSAADAAIGLVRGNPLISAMEERGVADADAIVHAVADALSQKFGDGPLRFPTRVRVLSARRQ